MAGIDADAYIEKYGSSHKQMFGFLRNNAKWNYGISSFKLSLTAYIILPAVNLRYTITDLIIKAVNFLISS